MNNSDISDLLNLFLINSEILLRITSRNQTIQTTCTYGGQEPSICKSFYSTRCATTTSVINTFFQKKILFYNPGNTNSISVNEIGISDDIFNLNNKDKIYDSSSYYEYSYNLNELFNNFFNIYDVIFTFSFTSPNYSIPYDNLVGHIFNIIKKRVHIASEPGEVDEFKIFLIQSYINKYSPVCIEISDPIFMDYIRVFYAIFTHSTYDFGNRYAPSYFDDSYVNINTLYIKDIDGKYINPWFNETFHKLFKDYYYYPFDNLGNASLSDNIIDLRYYTSSRISIAELYENDIIYYNMINFMYSYYNILSYDIYSFREYYNNFNDKLYINQNSYIISDYHEFVDTSSTDKNINEYYNPTIYFDDSLLTYNAHTISFWENNLFLRTSYIISDMHIDIMSSDFTYDLYSTLLFSAKNSIMYTLNYKNIFSCYTNDLILSNDMDTLTNNSILIKYINGFYFLNLDDYNNVTNLLDSTFLPTYNLITSFDIYDYFNSKSCLVYRLFTNTILSYQKELDLYVNPIDHPLMVLFNNLITTLRAHNDFSQYISQKVYYLYMYSLKASDVVSFNMFEEVQVTDSTGSLINVRNYEPRKMSAFLNILITVSGFYFIEKINNNISDYYKNFKNKNRNVDFITYEDLCKMYYTSPYDDVNAIILEILNSIRDMYDAEYVRMFPENELINDTIKKSYLDYISFIKNYIINYLGVDESEIIDNLQNTYGDNNIFL